MLGLRPESNKTGTDRAAARAERQGRTMDFRETDRVETSDVATAELTRTEAETPVESTAGVKAKLNGDVEPTVRSEEHTSELQSIMRNSYAVFCLKNKKTHEQTP